MPRRKTVVEDIIDILQELLIPYVAFLILFWIAKRDLFWKMLIGGIIFFYYCVYRCITIQEIKNPQTKPVAN